MKMKNKLFLVLGILFSGLAGCGGGGGGTQSTEQVGPTGIAAAKALIQNVRSNGDGIELGLNGSGISKDGLKN
jgi:hypothetical protein